MESIINVGERTQEKITSLDLLKQINLFRVEEGNRAELQHKTLLEIIRDEFEEEIGMQKILPTLYKHPQNGQEYPMFELTLSQAKQVLVRESKFVRKAVISYIEKLENALMNNQPKLPSYAEALRQLADKVEENERLQLENKEMKPKAEFFDTVADSKTAISMNDVAKVLDIKGMGRNNLFEFLRNEKILMSNNVPFQIYVDRGYFRVIEQKYMKNGEPCMNIKTLVYQKGVDFISKTIKNKIK